MSISLFSKRPAKNAQTPPEIIASYTRIKELGQGTWGVCYFGSSKENNELKSVRALSNSFSKKELSAVDSAVRLTSFVDSIRFQHAESLTLSANVPCLSSQFVAGENLVRIVKRKGRLSVRQSIYCIARAIEGLDAAYKKSIVHGELRPSKIIIDSQGTVTIRDLAIAQVTRLRRQFNLSAHVLETPKQHVEYLAPEILVGGNASFSSDLYSLGCILFYLLTGKPPYPYKDLKRIVKAHQEAAIPQASRSVKDIPASLEVCLERMLAKQPINRFANYKQCHDALRAVAKSLPKDEPLDQEQWEQVVDVDQAVASDRWSSPSSIVSTRLVYTVGGLVLLAGVVVSAMFAFRTVKPTTGNAQSSDSREIQTTGSEDSFRLE
ncbi:MAG: protein kinase [Pirellulaceae bacterium]|nr:protein kinase [Pirellulaceae bacterium]